MPSSEALPDVFQAVADRRRRELLDLLREGERPVSELAAGFDISLAAVSQHLKVLREAGLVSRRARGRERIYRLNPRPLREIHDWTALYRRGWKRRVARLREYLDEEEGR